MSHLHTCLNCDNIIGEGGDCEFDEDHPYQLCNDCRDVNLNDSEPS